MLNPVNHTRTAPDVERYKAEPYHERQCSPHPRPTPEGRLDLVHRLGGWMYRAGLKSVVAAARPSR